MNETTGSVSILSTLRKWRTITALILIATVLSSCRGNASSSAGVELSTYQRMAVSAALIKIRACGLINYADLGDKLFNQGLWLAASPTDPYIAGAEKSGDTPFAYTLPDNNHPKQPIAIVLASRFFTDADPTAQAALMVHEMGHWMAFQRQGSSTEYDGYKAEFDAHKKLGLTNNDGLVYVFMLDGVEENVVPIDKSYAKQPEIEAYVKESTTGEM